MEITTIGLDLAKNVFHVVGCNQAGKPVIKKRFRRSQMLNYFARLPSALIGMEGCGGAHYWARELSALGHRVHILPAQHVKAFVQGNKNDYNDALAIAEAVVRPRMRVIPVKTVEQQDIQALHRLRQGQVKARTGHSNCIRGLLGEYGIAMPQGIATLRKRLPEILEDAENGLSEAFRELLAECQRQLIALDEQVSWYDQKIVEHSKNDAACQRLRTAPGFGPVNASVFAVYVGDGSGYRRGRDVSASLGLVPRQHSSGGKSVLLGISKRGDRYLRCLLVHGARAVVRAAANKDDKFSRWINKLRQQRGVYKTIVAVANKMARIGWAIIHHKTVYQVA